MPTFLEGLPFPFHTPAGPELWRTLARIAPCRSTPSRWPRSSMWIRSTFRSNSRRVSCGTWSFKRQQQKGSTTDLVKDVLAQNPRNRKAQFLKDLIDDLAVRVSPEPVQGFDSLVTAPEAWLFTDDLTVAAGRVPNLIATLQQSIDLAPAVCVLRVENALEGFNGTGFRIGSDLVLTNHHVLFPEGIKAAMVQAELRLRCRRQPYQPAGDIAACGSGYDRGRSGRRLGVIPGRHAEHSGLKLTNVAVPSDGDRAFIVQLPDGQQKRLGFVHNMITAMTNDEQRPSCLRSGSRTLSSVSRLVSCSPLGHRPVAEMPSPRA